MGLSRCRVLVFSGFLVDRWCRLHRAPLRSVVVYECVRHHRARRHRSQRLCPV